MEKSLILETINKSKFKYPLPDILLKGKAYYSLDSFKKQQIVLLEAVKAEIENQIDWEKSLRPNAIFDGVADTEKNKALEDLIKEIDNTLSKLK